jgi:copper chaperone CopZ
LFRISVFGFRIYFMSKAIYKITGMDCDSCAKMIELDLEDAGIKDCKCSFADKTLEINQEHNENVIVEIIQKSGYSITT